MSTNSNPAKHPTDLEWRNATVNFVTTDSFANGDTSTQQNKTTNNP
ncbi:MAG: hypothetical protein PUD91_03735 [Bacteroidales bacterium]|nr:hypothetical protein [Bacteroidales bacterium]